MKHQSIPYVALGAAAMMLAGCGGGGSNSSAPTIPTSYTITDLSANLPNPYPSNGVEARAINNAGQVVGNTYRRDDTNPNLSFTYSAGYLYSNGSFQDLAHPATIAPDYLYIYDINNKGQILGIVSGPESSILFHTVVLDQNGITDINKVTGNNFFTGFAINDAGMIAGYNTADASGPISSLAIVYNGKVQNVGRLPAFTDIFPTKVNSAGQIIGYAFNVQDSQIGHKHGFLYSAGQMTDIGPLPGYTDSIALGINNSGQIVGGAGNLITNTNYLFLNSYSFANCHAFLKKGATVTDLGTLPGDDASIATGINGSGQIVGGSGKTQNFATDGAPVPYAKFTHAFLYSQGKMVDLNTLLPTGSNINLTRAIGINDHGQIVSEGYNGTVQSQYVLTPKS